MSSINGYVYVADDAVNSGGKELPLHFKELKNGDVQVSAYTKEGPGRDVVLRVTIPRLKILELAHSRR